jgi:UDP-N-acetylmuramoylalanine--D-glutamate ligase
VINIEGQPWLAHGDQTLLPASELHLTGEHNIANALAALALGQSMKLPMATMIEAVKNYRGLPHRCQQVDTSDGIRWIDDSKATNVGACIAAIEGLNAAEKIILIAGGVAKEQDFSDLTAVLKRHAKAVVLIGQDADLIQAVIPKGLAIYKAADMSEAVNLAQQTAQADDIVLLSPACASFDMFSNYMERGEAFARAVEDATV